MHLNFTGVVNFRDMIKEEEPDLPIVSTKSKTSNSKKNYDRCALCKKNRASHPERKFFRFPKDPVMCRKWVTLCDNPNLLGKSVKQLNISYRLCSLHFNVEDYASTKFHRLAPTACPRPLTSGEEFREDENYIGTGSVKVCYELIVEGDVSTTSKGRQEKMITPKKRIEKMSVTPKKKRKGVAGSSPNMATRWGIVSAGKISHDFVTCLRSLPKCEHEVVAIAARSLDEAEEFAALHNIPKAYGSYEELANDPNVEIAYIGVINNYHYPLGKMMLNAGKNVLMEKPMGMNLRETKELIELAEENDVFLMEAVWSRFFPIYKQLTLELNKKSIGDIICVHCSFGFEGRDVERVQMKDLGGGAILDIGVYMANAVSVIFREKPQEIKAVAHFNKYGVDESLSASLKYSKGRLANFTLSTVAELPNKLVITGTKGKIKIPKPCWCPTKMITPEKTHTVLLPDTVLPCNFPNSAGLQYEAMAVRECLCKGLTECPLMTHKDSLLLAWILEELRNQIGLEYPADYI